MEPAMLFAAIASFPIAAAGGITMAVFVFMNRYPPLFLIVAHGFFGIGALGLAIWCRRHARTTCSPRSWW